MGNVKANDKLPDTLTPLSLTQEQKEIRLPWGRLYSCLEKCRSVDLIEDIITLGRGEQCTYMVCKENYPENTMMNISKLHFTIIRDNYAELVYLKDHSKNGTFVNGTIVGKGNKNILQHDDILSVGFKGNQKLFVFKLLNCDESNKYLPEELQKKYKLSKFLGKGACGEVHLLFEKTTARAYAVKKIKKGIYSSGSIHHLDHPVKIMNEVEILRSLAHPDNVLLQSDLPETLVKITDFGLSKFLNEYTMMETICGTPTYVAPEVIDSSYSEYSKQVDIWSLGVILFYMLCKDLPFRSSERATLNCMIKKGLYKMDSERWKSVSLNAINLVRKMLVVNPQERLNIEQVLLHPWLSEDIRMQQRAAEVIKYGTHDSDFFLYDTENQDPEGCPAFKKIKLLETTL
ncbi:hypothetical protein WA026_000590 [Henosepilachna vigintioctopunctata]|uniref:Uncharacterized protein n=1 Tax=Henosepilachna vigintioctopunctata TaxID=420089 RepID=A0AAW1UYZ3_9CUCU